MFKWVMINSLLELRWRISALVHRINDLGLLYITDDSKIFESENEMLGQLNMY